MIKVNTNNGILMLVIANILTINIGKSVLFNFTTGYTLELGFTQNHCGRDFQFVQLDDTQYQELLMTLESL